MSLSYLNGIGGPRRQAKKAAKKAAKKSGSTSRKGGRHKGALKRIIKVAPKNPVAAARMAKKVIRKSSPLNAIRIKKAITQERQRAIFEQGEPMTADEMEINQGGGEDNFQDQNESQGEEQEFDVNEEAENEGADDMNADAQEEEIGCADIGGLLYPVAINGKQRKAKKAAKTDKKKASAEAKRTKSQAKLEKAKQGTGKFSALLNKGLDTAGKYLDKGKGGAEKEEKEEKPSFFAENKGLIIGGGLGVAALLLLPKLLKK